MNNTWIFDLDGTLVDKGIYAKIFPVIIQALKDQKEVSQEKIDETIAEVGEDTWSICHRLDALDMYYEILLGYIEDGELIPGTLEVLQKLKTKGTKIILASNSHRRTIEMHLLKHDIAKYFDIIWGNEDAGDKKTDSYWDQLKMTANLKEPTVVSDDLRDIEQAKKRGWKTIHLGTDVITLKDIKFEED